MSTQNLIWLVVILAAAGIVFAVSGWKVALVVVVVLLVIGEIVQRRARSIRMKG